MNLSLDPQTAALIRARAQAQQKPVSQYVAELVRADARSAEDALAAEGYRLLSGDIAGFAEDAWQLTGETWPEWGDSA